MPAPTGERRRDRAETWLERFVPPHILNAFVSFLLLTGLSAIGVKVKWNGDTAVAAAQAAEETKAQIAVTMEDVKQAMTEALAANYAMRTKTGTMTSTLSRIEAKIDALNAKITEESR